MFKTSLTILFHRMLIWETKKSCNQKENNTIKILRGDHTPTVMANNETTDNTKCWSGQEATETLAHKSLGGMGATTTDLESSLAFSYKDETHIYHGAQQSHP